MSFEAQLEEEKAKEQQLEETVRTLEMELANVKAELLRQQGAVAMLEKMMLSGAVSAGISDSQVGSQADSANRRAKRSTKKEMQVRRRIVIKVLSEQGSSTANEILPTVNELLGYDLKIHHLRNVLKKFTSSFKKGEDHGVWCLTESALQNQGLDGFGDSDESESGEDSSESATS